jgi:hypothetical protein
VGRAIERHLKQIPDPSLFGVLGSSFHRDFTPWQFWAILMRFVAPKVHLPIIYNISA